MQFLQGIFGLTGKTALVTGAATGVGRMIAEGLAQAGANVIVVSRKVEASAAAASEIEALGGAGRISPVCGDVGSEESVRRLVTSVRECTGRLDIIVNNAGQTWGADIASFPYDAWDRVLRVNLSGMFSLTRDLLPMLQEAGSIDDPSRVINIGSVMGYAPIAHNAYSYAASKAGVHHLTKILAKEYAGKGVTFNALALGPFPSKMTAFVVKNHENYGGSLPSGRMGAPEDVIAPLLYLCGRGGAYTTGAVIPVDGGVAVQSGTLVEES